MTELLVVLRGLGVRAVQPICRQTPSAKVVLSREGGSLTAAVVRASQVTGARARELIGSPCDGPVVVVADRITDDARSLLSAAGWSWLDLRGHLHLRGKGLLIDTAVDAAASPLTPRRQSPLRGKARLAVAYWLCAHPDEVLSLTGHSADLSFAPSTISTAAAALADSGLVDEGRRAVLPELFWELAAGWRPQWTWLAGPPDPTDHAEAQLALETATPLTVPAWARRPGPRRSRSPPRPRWSR